MSKFADVLRELQEMHDRKNADYGRPTDPFANVRAGEDFGIEPWVSAMVRGNDKMRRLQKAAKGGTLTNEGIEDSLIDLAVYTIIALILFREGEDNPKTTTSNYRYGLSPTTMEWTMEWTE